MDRAPRLAALLLLVGLVAVTNPLWLFPHDGDQRYTYERAEVTVENGTLDYRGRDVRQYHTENDLVDVGCQPRFDGVDRACAFDRHLLAEGRVTVPGGHRIGQPTYVRLPDGYYERLATRNGSGTTYDVERVAPRELLAAVAQNVSNVDPAEVDASTPVPYRVAVTGETARTFDRVPAVDLGRVYLRNGSYHTVVLTDETAVDRMIVSETLRDLLTVGGLTTLFGSVVLVLGRLVGPDD